MGDAYSGVALGVKLACSRAAKDECSGGGTLTGVATSLTSKKENRARCEA